jgi:hypothetical protein
MSFRYATGEEVQPGDRILYHGQPGLVEFIAEAGDAETGRYVTQFGGGFMIVASGFGLVFISGPNEDLEFVERDFRARLG